MAPVAVVARGPGNNDPTVMVLSTRVLRVEIPVESTFGTDQGLGDGFGLAQWIMPLPLRTVMMSDLPIESMMSGSMSETILAKSCQGPVPEPLPARGGWL